jgi:hypothetical protein
VCRRQFNGEWQPVQSPANLRDHGRVLRGQRESRVAGESSIRKKTNGRILTQFVKAKRSWAIRQRQRQDGHLLLSADPQPLTACGEHLYRGARLEELRNPSSGGQEVLEVVEDEKHPAAVECCRELREKIGGPHVMEPQVAGDGEGDVRGVSDRRKRDEANAVAKVVCQRLGNREGESRLPHASRTGEGKQLDEVIQHKRLNGGAFGLPADESGTRKRDDPRKRS